MAGLSEEERAEYRAAHHQQRRRLSNATVGFLIILVTLAALYLAFVKHIPFTGHGYTVEATFANAMDVQPGNPVRIAGINVGEVLGTDRDGNNTIVRFNVDEDAAPIHSDASVRIRPRIFFEGSYFLDLRPGSPSAPEMPGDGTIPLTRTASAVQFDEVLTALKQPVRDDLRELLSGYGTALTHVPEKPSENRGFEPEIQGKSAGQALNMAFDYGEDAGKHGAQVMNAFQGEDPDDLSKLIAATGKTFDSFNADSTQLQALIGNWNTFTGALAAESANVTETFALFPPTLRATEESLAALNSTLPVLRGWARSFEPSIAKLPAFIEAADPWLDQADPLLSKQEAGGLIVDLRKSMPGLTGAAKSGIGTLKQIGLLSRCTSNLLVPTGDQVIADDFSTGGPNSREFFYAATNLSGESGNFTGNGAVLRLAPSIGDVLTAAPNPFPYPPSPLANSDDKTIWSNMSEAPKGTQPQLGGMPPKKPAVPCHTNDVPDLNSGLGESGPGYPTPTPPPAP